MFTSVTKKSASKHFFTYIALTIFSLVFTFVYERFSYGESSMFMRMMFFAPLAGALIYLLTGMGMSWMKTNVKLAMDESDATIADLITDGCNMGVKSLSRYLNQYQAADEETKDIAKKLIKQEEELSIHMRSFL